VKIKDIKLLENPDTYQAGTYGGWKLKIAEQRKTISMIRSYSSGMVEVPKKCPTLYDSKGVLWMSLMPMESESQYYHNEYAFGHVIVMGAGMGLLPYNLLRNPNVDRITIIEKDRDVYDHWFNYTGASSWPNQAVKMLQLHHADAREFRGECDTLIADIWADIGADELEEDMATFRKNVKFKRMMCWGAELAFISWCIKEGVNALTASDEHAQRWSEETGHFVWPGFANYATDVAHTSLMPVSYRSFGNKK